MGEGYDNEAPEASGAGSPAPSSGTPLRAIPSHTPMEIFAGGIAGVSVASSVAAMVLSPVNIVVAAGLISCAIGPYAYWQQRRLTDIVALQETHKALSEQVDKLGEENARLHDAVVDLGATVDGLEDVEQALDMVTETQGQSIEVFEKQVKDNQDILGKMQSNLKANVMQNLLQVVISVDSDDDMTIGEHEIQELIDRIQGIQGVDVNDEHFRDAITKSGGSMNAVMDIIRKLMSDDPADEGGIFIIKH